MIFSAMSIIIQCSPYESIRIYNYYAAGVLAVVGESQTMQPFLEKCIIIGPGWDQCNYDIVV